MLHLKIPHHSSTKHLPRREIENDLSSLLCNIRTSIVASRAYEFIAVRVATCLLQEKYGQKVDWDKEALWVRCQYYKAMREI